MADTLAMAIEIGADVSCLDGSCGTVTRVVVDPVASAVTHLVIQADRHLESGRLVPVDLVATLSPGISLRCTRAEFDQLDSAEESDFLPDYGGYQQYKPDEVLAWPYFGLGTNMRLGGMEMGYSRSSEPVVYDTVPLGEVDIHRGEAVRASDGEIGQVHGLVIDPRNHQVTHVLVQEGHLWGRKQVAIPIKAVTRVDGMVVDLSRQQVHDLPPVLEAGSSLIDPGA
jgi:sporulation protein YlmC with PRC-barrel domain